MRPVDVLRNYKPAKAAEQAVIASGLQAGEMVVSKARCGFCQAAKVRMLKPSTQIGPFAENRRPEGAS